MCIIHSINPIVGLSGYILFDILGVVAINSGPHSERFLHGGDMPRRNRHYCWVGGTMVLLPCEVDNLHRDNTTTLHHYLTWKEAYCGEESGGGGGGVVRGRGV